MSLWCHLNLHRWSMPGGECEDCGYPDTIFDHPAVAAERMTAWRAARKAKR